VGHAYVEYRRCGDGRVRLAWSQCCGRKSSPQRACPSGLSASSSRNPRGQLCTSPVFEQQVQKSWDTMLFECGAASTVQALTRARVELMHVPIGWPSASSVVQGTTCLPSSSRLLLRGTILHDQSNSGQRMQCSHTIIAHVWPGSVSGCANRDGGEYRSSCVHRKAAFPQAHFSCLQDT
jgi:hypothetical protein